MQEPFNGFSVSKSMAVLTQVQGFCPALIRYFPVGIKKNVADIVFGLYPSAFSSVRNRFCVLLVIHLMHFYTEFQGYKKI